MRVLLYIWNEYGAVPFDSLILSFQANFKTKTALFDFKTGGCCKEWLKIRLLLANERILNSGIGLDWEQNRGITETET